MKWYWKKGEEIIAKSSQKYKPIRIGCLKLLDSWKFREVISTKLSITTTTFFPKFRYDWNEGRHSGKKLAYPFENKSKTMPSIQEPLVLERKDLYSTFKQSTPSGKEISGTRMETEKHNKNKGKELTMMYVKNNLQLSTDILPNYVITCISTIGNNPIHSYSIPAFTWKANLRNTWSRMTLHIWWEAQIISWM